jgi:hypothetical protein
VGEVFVADHPPQLPHRRSLRELGHLGIGPHRRFDDLGDLLDRQLPAAERVAQHRELGDPLGDRGDLAGTRR